jgi:HTH-type transcriptional regulator / antitoxin HigA
MKYSEIVNKKQYQEYCNRHLELGKILGSGKGNADMESEYYVIDLIIEDYKNKQTNPFDKLTPVDLLKALMNEYGYTGYRLHKELGISQSVISNIINYKREFSKDVIRKLSAKFKIGKESFLKEYELIGRESHVA